VIANNDIRDVSSNGIVFFGGAGTIVRDNEITNSTTSGWAGINVGDAIVPDNTGVVIENNHVVAKGPRYFQQGIDAALHVIGKTANVAGVTVRGNRVEGISRYGLIGRRLPRLHVTDNDVSNWHPLPRHRDCPAPPPTSPPSPRATPAAHRGWLRPTPRPTSCPGEPEVLGELYRSTRRNDRFPDTWPSRSRSTASASSSSSTRRALLARVGRRSRRAPRPCAPRAPPATSRPCGAASPPPSTATSSPPPTPTPKAAPTLTAAPPGTPCSPPAP
jgi:hypothetical protein